MVDPHCAQEQAPIGLGPHQVTHKVREGTALGSRASPQSAGLGLAWLVGSELQATHQGAQRLAVFGVTGVPRPQHIGLGFLVQQPQHLGVLDLWAGAVLVRGQGAGDLETWNGGGVGCGDFWGPGIGGWYEVQGVWGLVCGVGRGYVTTLGCRLPAAPAAWRRTRFSGTAGKAHL